MDTSFLRESLGPLLSRKQAARYLTERGMETAPQNAGAQVLRRHGAALFQLEQAGDVLSQASGRLVQ
jgi:hypothetical protein